MYLRNVISYSIHKLLFKQHRVFGRVVSFDPNVHTRTNMLRMKSVTVVTISKFKTSSPKVTRYYEERLNFDLIALRKAMAAHETNISR